MGFSLRRNLVAALPPTSLVALVTTFAAVASPAQVASPACPAYAAEISVEPSREFGGSGYDVVAALRDPGSGSRIVTIEAEVRRGQVARSSREVPAGGGTFSLSIEVGRSGSPTAYTLELTKDGRTLLVHTARLRLPD